jgi:putative endonuclease
MDRITSKELGSFGETVAVGFLKGRGYRIVGTNVFVDRDEIDIVYQSDGGLVAVEVKTVRGDGDPFAALTDVKMHRLRRAISGYAHPIVAIDAIGVVVGKEGAEVRWLRGIG